MSAEKEVLMVGTDSDQDEMDYGELTECDSEQELDTEDPEMVVHVDPDLVEKEKPELVGTEELELVTFLCFRLLFGSPDIQLLHKFWMQPVIYKIHYQLSW